MWGTMRLKPRGYNGAQSACADFVIVRLGPIPSS